MFKIGEFSQICRVPVSALRYYADLGLLEPARVDQFTGYRYYSLDQLPRLNRILALKDLGLSLEQIKQILGDQLTPEQIRGMLKLRQAEICDKVREAQSQLDRVEARLRQIELEGTMPTHEVIIKPVAPQRALSIRQVIPAPDGVAALLTEAGRAAMGAGVNITGAPYVIFHDPEFKLANLDVEAVFPANGWAGGDLSLDDGRKLIAHEVPGAEAACIVHAGAYELLPQSYEALGQWIEANRYNIAGPPREVYLQPPGEAGGPVTEIQWPVAKE